MWCSPSTDCDDPPVHVPPDVAAHATDRRAVAYAADIVIVGEPGHAPDGADPLVTVSITPVGHGGPDDGMVLTDEVLQARSGSLAAHGHAHLPPLTVAGNLGEYVTGAFARSRRGDGVVARVTYGHARGRRRLDARSAADDVRDRTHADGALSRWAPAADRGG